MPVPLSEQIRQRLLSAIMSGRYGPEGPLPTIRELARSFKVSTNTVQKAIHQLCEEGILEARRRRGTVIRSVQLRARNSRRVAVALPYGRTEGLDRRRGWPDTVLIPLRQRLAEAGYSLVLCPLLDMDEFAIVEHLRGLELAGIVLFEVYNDHLVTEIRELRLPMVSADYDAFHLGISSVVFDNAWGCFQATRFLIERGHRHIVTLHPHHTRRIGRNAFRDAVDKERVEGYRLAMKDAGLPVRIEEFPKADDAFRVKLLELLAGPVIPTALVCRDDRVAQAVAKQLQALEFRIPQDISVIGFGDEGLEFAPGRRLSSVWVDREGMGQTTAQYVLREMKKPSQFPQRHVLPTQVVDYDSVSPIRPPSSRLKSRGLAPNP